MHERKQGLRPRAIALIVLASLFALIALAWGAEQLLTDPEGIAPVRVIRNGEVVAEFSMDELRRLPSRSFSQLGKLEEGPSVLDVLAEAGVTDFDRLTVRGAGIRDDGLLMLERTELTDEVLLDFANRGTVKIAGPDITWEDRVRDVTELEAE